MISHRFLLCACIVLLLLNVLCGAQGYSSLNQQTNSPDWVIYRHLFRDVVVLNKRADAAERQGSPRPNLRKLVSQRHGLTDAQDQVLATIAFQCEADVAAQDARAKTIIDAYHARYASNGFNRNSPPPSP